MVLHHVGVIQAFGGFAKASSVNIALEELRGSSFDHFLFEGSPWRFLCRITCYGAFAATDTFLVISADSFED